MILLTISYLGLSSKQQLKNIKIRASICLPYQLYNYPNQSLTNQFILLYIDPDRLFYADIVEHIQELDFTKRSEKIQFPRQYGTLPNFRRKEFALAYKCKKQLDKLFKPCLKQIKLL